MNVRRSSCKIAVIIFASDFRKIHYKCYEIQCRGSRVVPYGRQDRRIDRRDAFSSFAKTSPKKVKVKEKCIFACAISGFFDFLTLEDETDRLSRNVGTELPPYTA